MNFLRTLPPEHLGVLIGLVGVLVGLVGVVVAFLTLVVTIRCARLTRLAYDAQLGVGRKKVKLRISYRRNDTHVSISATNIGCAFSFDGFCIKPDGLPSLIINGPGDFVKNGASARFSIMMDAINRIPVNVKSRFVFDLSMGGALRTRPVDLSKVIYAEEKSELVTDAEDTGETT